MYQVATPGDQWSTLIGRIILISVLPRLVLLASLEASVSAFQLDLSFSIRPALDVKIFGSRSEQPVDIYLCAGANKIPGGEDELLEGNPLRLFIDHSGRVHGHDLVVLGSEVMPLPLKMRNLHKQSRSYALSNVVIEVLVIDILRLGRDSKS